MFPTIETMCECQAGNDIRIAEPGRECDTGLVSSRDRASDMAQLLHRAANAISSSGFYES